MKKISDELKSPAKKRRLDQDLQREGNFGQSDDPVEDTRHPDSEALTPVPVTPMDNLGKDHDIKELISRDIGGAVKKAALRKLFHSPEFNSRDGLDDYDADFQLFEHIGNIVTSEMRYHLERLSGQKKDSRLKGDSPGALPPDGIRKNAGPVDSKSAPVLNPKIANSIPVMATVGKLLLQPDLCAHGTRGLTGCTRCLEACPSGAINTSGGTIRIDPESCRQKGLCTTVCPTGALKLLMPTSSDLLTSLGLSLAAAPDPNPVLIFYDAGFDPSLLQTIPEKTLGFCLDSIEAVGMEIWLGALAYGAAYVVLLTGNGTEPAVLDTLKTQISLAGEILEGMGLEKERIQIIREDHPDQGALLNDFILLRPVDPIRRPERFEPVDTKRALMFQSIDYLYEQVHGNQSLAVLAHGAPFGEIIIDPDSCTLCMACVAVCPAKALWDGGEMPQIRFLEGQCLQCGLCSTACPENAICLSSRMVFEPEARSSLRILHGAEPFCCVVCGRPFAARAIVDKMLEKLSGHWMYQNDEAKNRLCMCGDCRSRNFFETGADR